MWRASVSETVGWTSERGTEKKKVIEGALPLEAVNQGLATEKSSGTQITGVWKDVGARVATDAAGLGWG